MDFVGRNTMLTVLWIFNLLLLVGSQRPRGICLTGVMTDVQSWVDEHGKLTESVDMNFSLDLSAQSNPTATLMGNLSLFRSPKTFIKYLSMARCGLTRVPAIFNYIEDYEGRNLSQTLEFLSFYGNTFLEISVPGQQYDVVLSARNAREITTGFRRGTPMAMWSAGFQRVRFTKLKELDLRSCGIGILDSRVFEDMPRLEALYLGGNSIHTISINAFAGLYNLLHLDLSNNFAADSVNGVARSMNIESDDVFQPLAQLISLDFSNTKLSNAQLHDAFQGFGKSLERVSLCHTSIFNLEANFFNKTSVRLLDVSGNRGVISRPGVLFGLEDKLEVLYANEIGLVSFDVFANFSRLEILDVANNEISSVDQRTARSLKSLQVIDFRTNRFNAWFTSVFRHMKSLKLLDLRSNMINIVSEDMINDFSGLSYVALTGNSIVCNCFVRDFIEIAGRNEMMLANETVTRLRSRNKRERRFTFHMGFDIANFMIESRKIMPVLCVEDHCFKSDLPINSKFRLLDYDEHQYSCLRVEKGGKPVPFRSVDSCMDNLNRDLDKNLQSGKKNLLLLLLLPGILLPSLYVVFMFRRNLRYCYVTMRNSAMLSMVNKHKIITEDSTFNYDVFVSYCNEDRSWVLDQLLSHLETDCSVSLCLHERDFQVGLSVLENIVSCMDRSKSIMLVISQQFLLSQWCQFELHLAQHRLLETRREDLILILLEDIPRRLRPNTLHYLMLTKTYIVWPKNKSEQHLFWKRVKKSITTQKSKIEGVSLA